MEANRIYARQVRRQNNFPRTKLCPINEEEELKFEKLSPIIQQHLLVDKMTQTDDTFLVTMEDDPAEDELEQSFQKFNFFVKRPILSVVLGIVFLVIFAVVFDLVKGATALIYMKAKFVLAREVIRNNSGVLISLGSYFILVVVVIIIAVIWIRDDEDEDKEDEDEVGEEEIEVEIK